MKSILILILSVLLFSSCQDKIISKTSQLDTLKTIEVKERLLIQPESKLQLSIPKDLPDTTLFIWDSIRDHSVEVTVKKNKIGIKSIVKENQIISTDTITETIINNKETITVENKKTFKEHLITFWSKFRNFLLLIIGIIIVGLILLNRLR